MCNIFFKSHVTVTDRMLPDYILQSSGFSEVSPSITLVWWIAMKFSNLRCLEDSDNFGDTLTFLSCNQQIKVFICPFLGEVEQYFRPITKIVQDSSLFFLISWTILTTIGWTIALITPKFNLLLLSSIYIIYLYLQNLPQGDYVTCLALNVQCSGSC